MTAPALRSRAAILVAGWAGFYLLGFSLAGALLLVPWAQSEYGKGPDLAGLIAGFGGLWVLWGMRPRSARKPEEGLPIPVGAHRRLRELVAEVSRQTRHPEPDELHLVVDANAFTYTTRSLFRRGKTVIGIGLPFLFWLDRDALRSVIAHEMGHHVGGDLRLGPWVHRTRRAIALTLDHLDGSSFLLDLPFALYGGAFLRRSLEVSRAQELQADRVAAETAGTEATARALSIIERKSPLWNAYFWSEIAPALGRGFLLPVAEGFAVFEANVRRGAGTDGARPERKHPEPSSEHDTHPSLGERLASLGTPEWEGEAGKDAAVGLLDDPAAAEDLAVRYVLVDANRKLSRIGWSEVTEKIWLPLWTETLTPVGYAFAKLTATGLSDACASLDDWADRTRTGLSLLSPEASRRRAERYLGMWLAVCLSRSGFEVSTEPGAPVRATRGDVVVEPFRVVSELVSGKRDASEWRRTCATIGLE
ncbi:MAG TPA: M48 family metallopeptidase [Polyangiaceae bacterium]|nr:M48 family metallopeptidase [Polyangiaceae bacterium]